MARNNPVKIWIIKQIPIIEPKLHQIDKFLGAGKSTTASFIILKIG